MCTVLIVEDNPDNMALVVFLLESAGHTVLSATDAEAGLRLARSEHPSLILMDIQLPGMRRPPGDVHPQARRHDAGPFRVIAVTAMAMKGDEERIRAAGCDGYIAKPMSYQAFLETVAVHLGTSPPSGNLAVG